MQLWNVEDQILSGVDRACRLVLQPIRLQIEGLGALNLPAIAHLRGMQREAIRDQLPAVVDVIFRRQGDSGSAHLSAVVDAICRRQSDSRRTALPAVIERFRRYIKRVLRDLRPAQRCLICAEIHAALAFQTSGVAEPGGVSG